MNKKQIIDGLKEIFVMCSLIDEHEEDIKKVEKMKEEIDSFTYMSILIEIENYFNIEIPDEYLGSNLLESIDMLSEIIERLIEQ